MVNKQKYLLYSGIALLLPLLLSGQWLETTIHVPDSLCGMFGPHCLAYNSNNTTIYVGGDSGNCVIAIDGVTNEKIAAIPAGSGVVSLCHNPTNNKVYCANGGNDNVMVIDGESNAVISILTAGDGPRCFTWNYVQNRTYVANYSSSSISVIRDSLTGIEELNQTTSPSFVDIYPNPIKTISTIHAYRPLRSVKMYDVLGNLVQTRTITKPENTVMMSVRDLSAGVYFLKVLTEDNEFIRKVVVTK